MRRKPTKKGCKIGENQAAIFGRISRPKCTLLCPKIEKCKFKVKLNDYWTNLHKN
jgi:hypothetical protein